MIIRKFILRTSYLAILSSFLICPQVYGGRLESASSDTREKSKTPRTQRHYGPLDARNPVQVSGSLDYYAALNCHPAFKGVFTGTPMAIAGLPFSMCAPEELAHNFKEKPELSLPRWERYTDALIGQMEALQHPNLPSLIVETRRTREHGVVNPASFYLAPWRVLAAISGTPSADALSIFDEFNGRAVDTGLREQGGWGTDFMSALALSHLKAPEVHIVYPVNVTLNKRVGDKLSDALSSKFSSDGRGGGQVFLMGKQPILGFGLLAHLFVEGVYPVALSGANSKAHGIEMTPLLMGLHDSLHGSYASGLVTAAYELAAVTQASHLLKTSYQIDEVVEEVSTSIVDRIRLLQDATHRTFYAMIQTLTAREDFPGLKKAVAGYFWMIHEGFSLDAVSIYDPYYSSVLERMIDHAKKSASHATSDIFQTDPTTGQSGLTPSQVRQTLIQNADGISQMAEFSWESQELRYMLEGGNFEYTLKQEPMVSTLTVAGHGGKEYLMRFPTLKYKFSETPDTAYLLKFAGYKDMNPKPDLEGHRNPRKAALNYIKGLDEKLAEVLEHFRTVSSFSITQSISSWFWEESRKNPKPTDLRPIVLPL